MRRVDRTIPSIVAIAKWEMRALLEAWGLEKAFKLGATDVAKGALLLKSPTLPLVTGKYGGGKAVTVAPTTKEMLEDPRISQWMMDWIYVRWG